MRGSGRRERKKINGEERRGERRAEEMDERQNRGEKEAV